MAIVVWQNLLGRQEARLSLQGWEFYRRAMVTGLSGTSSVSRLRAAVQALADLGVYLSAPHPDVFTAKCEALDPVAEAVDAVRVDVTYREHANNPVFAGLGILEVGASIQQITTDKDYNGTPITVTYTGSKVTSQAKGVGTSTDWQTQQCQLSAPRPQATIHYTRQESANPINKARQYVGTTNSGSWAADPGAPNRSWLCTGITGRTKDGRIFEVSYSFQFATINANGDQNWDDVAFWVDPGTGKPPSDAATGSSPGGQKSIQICGTNDFNALGLV